MRSFCAFILTVRGCWRGDELTSQLGRLGIEFSIVEGRDGDLLSSDELEYVYSARAATFVGRQLSAREVACAMGHQQLMRQFLLTGDEWALLLEDDVVLLDNAEQILDSISGRRTAPVVVQLQHLGTFGSGKGDASTKWNTQLLHLVTPISGAAAYLINRSAAQSALEAYSLRPIDSAADWPFNWKYRVNFYACWPIAAKALDASPSVIDSSRHGARTTQKRGTLAGLIEKIARALMIKTLLAPAYGVSSQAQFRHDLMALRFRILRTSTRSRLEPRDVLS